MGTFNKGISELTNPRLQRLREKVAGYQFTVIYVPGKTHNIADALSRAPIFPGSEDLDIQVDTAFAQLATTSNPALKVIYESIDKDYLQCIKDIEQETRTSHLIEQLKNIKSEISICEGLLMRDAKRIILPKNAIKPIMNNKARPATVFLAKHVE